MHTATCDVVRVIDPNVFCLEKYFIPTFLLMIYDCDFFYSLYMKLHMVLISLITCFFLIKGKQCFYLPCYTEAAQMVFLLFVSAS
jgi:hypothetical protein